MAKPETKTRMENLKMFIDSTSLHAFEGQLDGDFGQLPAAWQERYRADVARTDGEIVYTVMSYYTPIAWVVRDKIGIPLDVVIPDVKYSPTTGKAQKLCREWLPFLDQLVTEV